MGRFQPNALNFSNLSFKVFGTEITNGRLVLQPNLVTSGGSFDFIAQGAVGIIIEPE